MRTALSERPGAQWPFLAGALVVGAATAELAYRTTVGPAAYRQFTVGSLAWRGAGKTADTALLLGLVVGFCLAYGALRLVERWLDARADDEGGAFRRLLGFTSLPAAIWVGASLLTPGTTLDLLHVAAVLVVLAVLLSAAAGRRQGTSPQPPAGVLAGYALLAATCVATWPVVASVAANRMTLLATGHLAWMGQPSPYRLVAMALVAGTALALWSVRDRGPGRVTTALLLAQAALPLGYFVAVPAPWLGRDGPVFQAAMGPVMVVALGLALAAWLDLARRVPAFRQAPAPTSPGAVLSPLALAGVLVAIRLSASVASAVPPDDYHFGEGLLPWWLLVDHGQIPFVDHVPARGLINYLNGGLGWLLFDGTTPGVLAAAPLLSVLMTVGGVLSIATLVGTLPAVALFLVTPVTDGLSQIDLANTGVLCVLLAGMTRWRPARWLVAWLVVGTAAVLLAPGQGGLLVVATLPLGAWQVGAAALDDPRRLGRTALTTLATFGALALLTPLGPMIVGALRYVTEHSAVAATAHGAEWALGFGSGPLPPWWWEPLRAGWIALALMAAVMLVEAVRAGDRSRLFDLAKVAVPVGALAVLFVFRASGRIDPGSPSRLALATVWMWSLLLPVLLHAAWGPGRWATVLALTFALGSVWTGPLGSGLDLRRFVERGLEASSPPFSPVRGDAVGLPNLGLVDVQPEHLARLVQLRRALDALLDPGETYLDLTNRNAEYYYLNRPVPIESGALYNLPNDVQQLRAIDRLGAAPVPVILAGGDAIAHDGGPPSLRTHAIYRYVMGLGYTPIRVGPLVLLVRPDRVERARAGGFAVGGDTAAMLDASFRLPDLGRIPESWGLSWSTLREAATEVRRIDAPPLLLHDVELVEAGTYRVTGRDPFVVWPLAPVQDGQAAGILTFEFACTQGDGHTNLDVYWHAPAAPTTGDTGLTFHAGARVVVPLDSAPRWLLQPAIDELRIDVNQPDHCPEFRVADVTLWQRRTAAEVDARLRRYH